MHRKGAALHLLRVSLTIATIAMASVAFAAPNHGRFWNSLDDSSRELWVMGVASGQEILLEAVPESVKIDGTLRISNRTAEALVEIMTEYYSDPANTFIPLNNMLVFANKKLSGSSESQLASELAELREYGKFLQDNY